MHAARFLSALLTALIMIASFPQTYALSSSLDTDGDGLTDATEDANGTQSVDAGETDPFNADSDSGGESDGTEIAGKRNPLDPTDDMTYDADSDGWVNGIEIEKKTDPRNPDTDNDGVRDALDAFPIDSRYQVDANANGLPDDWETATGLARSLATPTTVEDPDGDGLTNAEEFARGTNPLSTDSDRDGVDDRTELEQSGDPKENACLSFGPVSVRFSDLQGHWGETIITRLSRTLVSPNTVPIIRGYATGSDKVARYFPDQSITRYEFLKMVILSSCMKIRSHSDDEEIAFTDVRTDAPIGENPDTALKRQIIYSGVHYGLIVGYSDGTFRPDAPVNRAEALKILSLAGSLQEIPGFTPATFPDVTADDWFSVYVSAASSRKIVQGYEDGTFRPQHPISRAEAAKIVYLTMLGNPMINGYVLPTE